MMDHQHVLIWNEDEILCGEFVAWKFLYDDRDTFEQSVSTSLDNSFDKMNWVDIFLIWMYLILVHV